MSSKDQAYRGMGWEHGAFVVQRYAGMLAPITFVLGDGRQISPMQIAPWTGEPEDHPGVDKKLRGDWACIPFGRSPDTSEGWPEAWAKHIEKPEPWEMLHGYGSNHNWTWLDDDGQTLRLAIDCPRDNPVKRLERTITPDANAPAVDIDLKIEVWEDVSLPFGVHPTFRLPTTPDSARIEPGRFREGRTFPKTFESGASQFALDAAFGDLAAVPSLKGSTIDASRLPFAGDSEDLLFLNGIDGTVAIANEAEGYLVRLSWQPEHFPSLGLWMTNRGRKQKPWNGRHVAIGLEPVCSPFGLGPATARADNPMAASGTPTAYPFKAATPFVTRYRISAEAL
jgi:hypothetical protein